MSNFQVKPNVPVLSGIHAVVLGVQAYPCLFHFYYALYKCASFIQY